MMPVMPPMVNTTRNEIAYSIGVAKRTLPPQMVPSQLKILIPVGMPITKLVSAKAVLTTGPSPVVNMWWLHTAKPMKPMKMPERMITGYPKSGLRLKVGITSEITPNAGSTMM